MNVMTNAPRNKGWTVRRNERRLLCKNSRSLGCLRFLAGYERSLKETASLGLREFVLVTEVYKALRVGALLFDVGLTQYFPAGMGGRALMRNNVGWRRPMLGASCNELEGLCLLVLHLGARARGGGG